MRQNRGRKSPEKPSIEKVIKGIRRAMRQGYSPEESEQLSASSSRFSQRRPRTLAGAEILLLNRTWSPSVR